MPKILIVDDEELFRERLSKAFSQRNFEVHSAQNYSEALQLTLDHQPDMAVFDLKMPGKSGIELLQEVKDIHPTMQVVVLTGYGSIATAIEAVKLGALSYISKPADVDDILSAFSKYPSSAVAVESEDLKAPSLARMEWEHISRVLQDCDDNISMASRRLGIHRRTLQRKLQKYPPKK